MSPPKNVFQYAMVLACMLLATSAAIHFYWAAGGHFGGKNAIPTVNGKRMLNPGPAGTRLVACCFLIMSICVAIRGGLIRMPTLLPICYYCTWLIAIIFVARVIGDFYLIGLFKTVQGTPFAQKDTALYTPLSLIIAALFFSIAVSDKPANT